MHIWMIDLLCEPGTNSPLRLEIDKQEADDVIEGRLIAPSGKVFPIRNRIPRFVEPEIQASVTSFGDQWNYFNFTAQKRNWLEHTVANTFGSTEAFANRLIVDAGGGSGAQSLWMLESGARHVILLELSHSVDDVVMRNLGSSYADRLDVIQCSIDAPPLLPDSINGLVICHNVIQHTPSVQRTAAALFAIVAPGGEFVFNCYRRGRMSVLNFVRTYLTYGPMRQVLSRAPFSIILAYSRLMGVLRLVPVLGWMLNKLRLSITGRIPDIAGESWLARKLRVYRLTTLNTFDTFGSHGYQHYLSSQEQRDVIASLQPDPNKVANMQAYFLSPQPTGCAVRVGK